MLSIYLSRYLSLENARVYNYIVKGGARVLKTAQFTFNNIFYQHFRQSENCLNHFFFYKIGPVKLLNRNKKLKQSFVCNRCCNKIALRSLFFKRKNINVTSAILLCLILIGIIYLNLSLTVFFSHRFKGSTSFFSNALLTLLWSSFS